MADTKLNKDIYGVEVKNHELLKLAYDAYLANSRAGSAKTLKRGEVRGGGKKPWKQKGTGRARFGSTRNPIWRSGGVAFGPTGNENFTKKLSKTQKRVAVMQALSLANEAKKIATIAEIKVSGKTKDAVKILEANKAANMNTLLVVNEKTDELMRATRNIQLVKVVRPMYLNVFDLLNADKILIEEKALKGIEEWLIGGENA